MNKNLLTSCLAFLIFAIIQMSSPAGTAAASPQEEQSAAASFLQVKATGPVVYGKHTVAEKNSASDASYMVSIPMNSDLNAFFDLVKPQEQTNKKSSLDFRPVFGFHITLR